MLFFLLHFQKETPLVESSSTPDHYHNEKGAAKSYIYLFVSPSLHVSAQHHMLMGRILNAR